MNQYSNLIYWVLLNIRQCRNLKPMHIYLDGNTFCIDFYSENVHPSSHYRQNGQNSM